MEPQFVYFIGIDWASTSYEICVLDNHRSIVERRNIEHSGAAISQWVEAVENLCHGHPEQVALAIETPRGSLVETLVERRFVVYAINPKQMDRFRDRHSVAGAKDDRKDAFVIADSLRTDRHLFHRVRLDDPQVIRIRELSRLDEDLAQDQVRTSHQLRELLRRYYPQLLALCPSVDETWFWDLIELAPHPKAAGKLTPVSLAKLLKAHRIRRYNAADILSALRVQPLPLALGVTEAVSEHVLLELPRLRLLQQQRKDVSRRIEKLLEEFQTPGQHAEHHDAAILLSWPGVGPIVAATMLAEASQPLAQRDYHALRSYTGIAPITRQSGKKKSVIMRHSCNERLRNALYHWSRVSSQHDPRSQAHYQQLRQAGHSHGRALRGVADRLLGVLIAMLKSGILYDPLRRLTQAVPETQVA